MPGHPSSDPTQFVQGSAVLHVPDVAVAVAFYRDVLGFASDFGDDNYAVVWRDNSALHFVKGDECPAGVHLFQWVRDVDALLCRVADAARTGTAAEQDARQGSLRVR